MDDRRLQVGSFVEVLPAYSMDTGDRSIWDDIAGCEAEVLEFRPDNDARVYIRGIGEEFVNIRRLKLLR